MPIHAQGDTRQLNEFLAVSARYLGLSAEPKPACRRDPASRFGPAARRRLLMQTARTLFGPIG